MILRRSQKAGLPPGAMIHVGGKRRERIRLSVINYDGVNFQEKEVKNVEEAFSFRNESSVTWLDIDEVHQPEIIEQVGKNFGMQPLVLEDIVNTGASVRAFFIEKEMYIVKS